MKIYILFFIAFQYSFSCTLAPFTLTRDTISAGVVENTTIRDLGFYSDTLMDTVYHAEMMADLYRQMDTNQIVFRGVIDSAVYLNNDSGSFSYTEDVYISVIEVYKGTLMSNSFVLRRHEPFFTTCDGSFSRAVNTNFLNFSNNLDSINDLDISVNAFYTYGNLFTGEELHAGYEPFWTNVEEIQGYTPVTPMIQHFASDKKVRVISNERRGLYLIRDKKVFDLKGRLNQISLPIK